MTHEELEAEIETLKTVMGAIGEVVENLEIQVEATRKLLMIVRSPPRPPVRPLPSASQLFVEI